LPVPDASEVTVIHGVAVVAVHEQVGAAVMEIGAPSPPEPGDVALDGSIDTAQPLAWFTVCV
jgi:hypothetical protein